MSKKIKSSFILKIIFTFVAEKQKLKLVKYNKGLQKNIHINIINYIFFKGKYIIYEGNKFGKEYFGYNGKLIYEGQYLNGERSGKGKEYHHNGKI